MWLLGIPFNQANVLFLPFILGEGIESASSSWCAGRWKSRPGSSRLRPATAKGVLLGPATTTVGFGSLIVSGHQGTFSLRLLATVGSLSVLLASLSVLPAFLRLVDKQAAARRERVSAPLDFKRLLFPVGGQG